MAHCNTIFGQMLKLIPRHHFSSLEQQHGTGRAARSFSRWDQFVHLLFMQLTGRVSLRDGIVGLKARVRSLYHLGVQAVARSTFADANKMRPAAFFEALFVRFYQRCQPVSPRHKFKFNNKLYSLDATVVQLCLALFPWASFRRTKGAVKLHTLLDHDGYLPAFVTITEGRRHEAKVASLPRLPRGSIVVVDRAYTDYAWFRTLKSSGLFFVIRQKSNAVYEVREQRPVPRRSGVTADQIISLTGPKAASFPYILRRVCYTDPETGKKYVYLTNNFRLSPRTIADIYKERWQIEIFFRWIKQNLKIKAFIGNSANAVMTQIYVALIAYLLICYFKFLSGVNIGLQELFRLLQLNLFRKCSLQEIVSPDDHYADLTSNLNQLSLNIV
jgi:putative transposase